MNTYTYSFSVWPCETWSHPKELFELFSLLSGRVEMTFTHADFENFRSSLNHAGFSLREIERVPYFESESVQ